MTNQHPVNTLPEPTVKIVRKYLRSIESLEPSEMFRVMVEREESMVYLPYNKLVNHIWYLVAEIEKLRTEP